MIDPVIAGDGYTYERTDIKKYIENEIVNVNARREAFECESRMEKLWKAANTAAARARRLHLPIDATKESIKVVIKSRKQAAKADKQTWLGGIGIPEKLRLLRYSNNNLKNWSIISPANKEEKILTTKLIPNHALKKAMESFNLMIVELDNLKLANMSKRARHAAATTAARHLLPPPTALPSQTDLLEETITPKKTIAYNLNLIFNKIFIVINT